MSKIFPKFALVRLPLLAVLFSLCWGCAGVDSMFDSPTEAKALRNLVTEGMDAFDRGRYRTALKFFEKVKERHPFSKFAILADLKVADSKYMLQEYDDAAFAYEEFEELHPKNEVIPYIIYRRGMCWFNGIDSHDRDQEFVVKAINVFMRLVRGYPSDPYAKKAEARIDQCYKKLAERDIYVGDFYLKSKHYKGALNRFQSVLDKYPDVGMHRMAMRKIEQCKALMEAEAKAEAEKKDQVKKDQKKDQIKKEPEKAK